MIAAYPMPNRTMLFDLPAVQVDRKAYVGRDKLKATQTPVYIRPRLWIDIDVPPTPKARAVPAPIRKYRARLRSCFDTGRSLPAHFGSRTHDLGQLLLPLLRRVSYTQELADGSFRVFVEYRSCDKFPHYRVLWGHLLWGRVDIRLDTDAHSADILSSPALPIVQARLADYLIALGYRLDTVRLQAHEMDFDDEYEGDVLFDADVKTDTREYRIFKINLEKERKQAAALAARIANTAS